MIEGFLFVKLLFHKKRVKKENKCLPPNVVHKVLLGQKIRHIFCIFVIIDKPTIDISSIFKYGCELE